MRVLVIGSGWHFTSGISYYTCLLSNALAQRHDVDAVLMRRLVPRRFYPGRDRVGQAVNGVDYDPSVTVLDGVDWHGRGLRQARTMIRTGGYDVVVLQWWTGAVLHLYLALARAAKAAGATVVIEFHEVQDTGEARIPGVARYVRRGMRALLARADAFVVHNEHDREILQHAYGELRRPTEVVPHGPYNHLVGEPSAPSESESESGVTRLLYFGIIRPYKGLEDLIDAFDGLDDSAPPMHLTVVGETWEGWTLPGEKIAAARHPERITFVNRYVHDNEVARFFGQADVVVLPYRRSSSSGPLHLAMSHGLPVVVSDVGGLREAADGYTGATFVRPEDVPALREAIVAAAQAPRERHADARDWGDNVAAIERAAAARGAS